MDFYQVWTSSKGIEYGSTFGFIKRWDQILEDRESWQMGSQSFINSYD